MYEQANNLINQLKDHYNSDRFHFDMNICSLLAGPYNKGLRVAIAHILTGEKRPAARCGIYAISDLLKAHYEQPKLF